MIAELNDWNDVTKAQTVLSYMSLNMRRNYQQFVNILGSRFEPRNQSELYRVIKIKK